MKRKLRRVWERTTTIVFWALCPVWIVPFLLFIGILWIVEGGPRRGNQ